MQRVILDWSLIAAIGTMVAWGMNFVFVKYVLDNLGFGAFMFLRFLVLPLLGLVLLLLIFKNRVRHTWPRRADLPRFLLCALVGHVIHISAVMYGMNLSTAFSSSLVLTCQPLFTLAILAWLGAERLRGQQIAGTLLAFAGISLVPRRQIRRRLLARRPGRPYAAGGGCVVLCLHGAVAPARRPLRAAHRAVLHAAVLDAADARR